MKKLTIILFTCCVFTYPLLSAPKLRLTTASVGPVDVVSGQNGPEQLVEAFNLGDGNLTLSVSSMDEWLSPSVGNSTACTTRQGTCVPIRVGINTAALELGVYTGRFTVADPNAFDAPQTVTVTVQVGGGVPDELILYVPPGGNDEISFETTSSISATTSTQSGGNWLSLAGDGAGSFPFSTSFRVKTQNTASLAAGTYSGAVNVTLSGFAPDVKQVAVTMNVTGDPITEPSASALVFDLVAGGSAAEQFVAVGNRGLGTLSVDSLETETTDGGEWLTVEPVNGVLRVAADPADLMPGLYEGTVRIVSNAVNSPDEIPVRLYAAAPGPPVAAFRGVVNNATFSPADPVPQGGIVAVFGSQFSYEGPASGSEIPLVTELGGAKVLVDGIEAPLFYSSSGQINFQVPYEVPPGEARVQVVRDGQPGNTVTVEVAATSPRILTFLGNYAIAVNTDGTFAVPTMAGLDSRPAHPGDTLVMYAIGFGSTVPSVATGAGAVSEPLSYVVPNPSILLGGGFLPLRITPGFVGLTPTYVGLYQINFTIPETAPRGDHVSLIIEGLGYATNLVEIAIE